MVWFRLHGARARTAFYALGAFIDTTQERVNGTADVGLYKAA